MTQKPLILITRPAQDAQNYAAELRGEGFDVFSEPMLEIVAQDFTAPDMSGYQGLLFTSANAVRLFSNVVTERDMSVYVVGQNTYEEAQKAGYTTLYSADGGGNALVELVRDNAKEGQSFLHIRGEHVARPIGEMLAESGISVDKLVVYRAEKVRSLSDQCVQMLKNQDIKAVTFFSKRTALNFMGLLQNESLGESMSSIKFLCISERVLECVRTYSWTDTYAAGQPDRQGMLTLIRDVCVPP